MRKGILAAVIVLGLSGSASLGTAQEKSGNEGAKWKGSMLCSDKIGKGRFSLTLYDDSTCRVTWQMECLGFNVTSSPVRGVYKLVDSSFSAVVKGFARTHHGPSSYYKGTFSGKLLETNGSGTYELLFFEEDYTGRGWPPEESGTWEVVRVK